jgi:alkanesulfonate monooxygenase SsuD/methylene tetrahydromethanopterin reductase-like flavin-dependent oxidoreductase (luciferase family)
MKFCLCLPPFGPYGDAQTLANLAQDAERAGWDGFFIWDHIAGERYPERMVDPWVALAAIALNTKKIRIGALVTPIPRRRPWKVARESVSIDHLSGGRLIFGVGTGSGVGEWDNLGEEPDQKTRGEMLDEGLEVVTALWSGKRTNISGKHYKIKDTLFLPKPIQEPRIPIWVAGIWPNKKPFRRAARWDGMFPLFPHAGDKTLDQLKDLVNYIKRWRDPDKPFDILFRGFPLPNDDPEEAVQILKPYEEIGVTWWQLSISPMSYGKELKGDWPLDEMRATILTGPPRLSGNSA